MSGAPPPVPPGLRRQRSDEPDIQALLAQLSFTQAEPPTVAQVLDAFARMHEALGLPFPDERDAVRSSTSRREALLRALGVSEHVRVDSSPSPRSGLTRKTAVGRKHSTGSVDLKFPTRALLAHFSTLFMGDADSSWARSRLEGVRVVVCGAGPVGLRTAIGAALMGADVTVVEREPAESVDYRHNVILLWSWVQHDIIRICGKDAWTAMSGKGGGLAHANTNVLQAALVRAALFAGVVFRFGMNAEVLLPPNIDVSDAGAEVHSATAGAGDGMAGEPRALWALLARGVGPAVARPTTATADAAGVGPGHTSTAGRTRISTAATAFGQFCASQVPPGCAPGSGGAIDGAVLSQLEKQWRALDPRARDVFERHARRAHNPRLLASASGAAHNDRVLPFHWLVGACGKAPRVKSGDMIPVIDGAERDFGFEAVQIKAAKAIAMVGFFERPGHHQAPQEAVFPTSRGGTAKEMKWVSQFDNPPLIGRINRRLGSLAHAAAAAGIVPEADTQFDTKRGKNQCAVENLVYFKGDTHYMVTTVSPDALVKCGVLPRRAPRKDGQKSTGWLRHNDPEKRDDLFKALAFDVVGLPCRRSHEGGDDGIPVHTVGPGDSDDWEVPAARRVLPRYTRPTHAAHAALFDFSSSTRSKALAARQLPHAAASGAAPSVISIVGDRLHEPFWPEGLGVNRGFCGALDTCWALGNYSAEPSGRGAAKAVELCNLLFAQYSSKLSSKCEPKAGCTVDPSTRYSLDASHLAALHAAKEAAAGKSDTSQQRLRGAMRKVSLVSRMSRSPDTAAAAASPPVPSHQHSIAFSQLRHAEPEPQPEPETSRPALSSAERFAAMRARFERKRSSRRRIGSGSTGTAPGPRPRLTAATKQLSAKGIGLLNKGLA